MSVKHTNPRFVPKEDGFKFNNRFDNTIYFGPFDWSIRTDGRCGGMSYAALDYFYARKTIPDVTETPPDGDYIGDYILKRQFDTFGSVADEFLAGMTLPGGGDMFYGRCYPQNGVDFNAFINSINGNKPCNLGLFYENGGIGNIGRCHQVLGIGYTKSTNPLKTLIHIYDPNVRENEMVLRLNKEKKIWEQFYYDQSSNQLGNRYKSWKAWFADLGYHKREVPLDTPSQITDLSGRDLTRWNPPTENLRNYRFVSSRFSGNGDLNSCDFKGVVARNALFNGATVVQSSFLEADLSVSNFIGANLRGTTFNLAKLGGANFERTELSDANFVGCLGGSDANPYAKLNFSYAKLNNTDMSEAKISASNFSYTSVVNSTFNIAEIRDSNFSFSALNNVQFSGTDSSITDMYSCDFRNSALKNCYMIYAVLEHADFSNVPISGCKFDHAVCSRAKFINSAIENTSMKSADISYADFTGAALNSVDLTDVDYRGSKWRGAALKSCRMEPRMINYVLSHGARF